MVTWKNGLSCHFVLYSTQSYSTVLYFIQFYMTSFSWFFAQSSYWAQLRTRALRQRWAEKTAAHRIISPPWGRTLCVYWVTSHTGSTLCTPYKYLCNKIVYTVILCSCTVNTVQLYCTDNDCNAPCFHDNILCITLCSVQPRLRAGHYVWAITSVVIARLC